MERPVDPYIALKIELEDLHDRLQSAVELLSDGSAISDREQEQQGD